MTPTDHDGDGSDTDIRELLARAVEADVTGPAFSTESVLAKASSARRRRRAALGGAALGLVTVAVFTAPGMVTGGTDRTPAAAASSADTAPVGGSGRQEKLTALLPASVGTVEEVSLAVMIKRADTEAATGGRSQGLLDGDYTVRRDHGVGLLHIALKDRSYLEAKTGTDGLTDDLCAPGRHQEHRADCVREELPGGRVLTIWRRPADPAPGAPSWGEELHARLSLPDGRALLVRDSAGFRGQGQLGPLLTSPPLTREQLRELALRPELLAETDGASQPEASAPPA
ncbi:hypothetical protein [Streptomyces sp. BK79]|uniref:hypothetical protein n=1 Tax=Streptomyces sp. BK79 TaxID=3350097 RepID=UPI00376F7FAD